MTYQYYTVEVVKNANGEYEHSVLWHFADSDEAARLKGESKFYEIMSRAAVSEFAEHGAILFSSRCKRIMDKCYIHATEQETESEVIDDAEH